MDGLYEVSRIRDELVEERDMVQLQIDEALIKKEILTKRIDAFDETIRTCLARGLRIALDGSHADNGLTLSIPADASALQAVSVVLQRGYPKRYYPRDIFDALRSVGYRSDIGDESLKSTIRSQVNALKKAGRVSLEGPLEHASYQWNMEMADTSSRMDNVDKESNENDNVINNTKHYRYKQHELEGEKAANQAEKLEGIK